MDASRLVEQARAGNVDAFTGLVQRYQAMAFGYAYATTGNFDLAEDAAQQAFITAWKNLSSLKHPDRFGGWLRGIVRFECLHLLRGRSASHLPIDLAPDIATRQPGPAELAEERESLDAVLRAINTLPDAERIAAVLFYVHDHSQREVAGFLDLPVSTVNNRLRNARKHLRAGGLLTMANEAFRNNPLPHDFAGRIGTIIRAEGSIIDARFGPNQRPPILNEVTITDDASGLALTAQVAQYLDDDLVRCFTLSAPSPNAATPGPGTQVRDLTTPVSLPMDTAALIDVIARMRGPASATHLVDTGIKAIDLFCPLAAGTLVGLAGDMQTGKMVLVEELIHRLGRLSQPLSVLVFVETSTEVKAIQQLDYRTSGSVEAIYLPVADPSPESLGPVLDRLDTVITFSRDLGKARLYPAIDPLRSTSRLLDPAIVGEDHVRIAEDARALLGSDRDPDRATRLRHYLSQPFYVAEAFTNRAGTSVPLSTTLADCRAILDGTQDNLDPETLYMTGAMVDNGRK